MLFRSSSEGIIDVARDADTLTMGITPSGRGILHHGHFATVMNLLRSLNAYPNQRATIFIDDREFNSQQFPELPDAAVVERVEMDLKIFIQRAAGYLLDESLVPRIQIQRMSEFYTLDGQEGKYLGEDLLNVMLQHRLAVGRFFPKMKISGVNGVRALCRDCDMGLNTPDGGRYVDGILTGQKCKNEECPLLGEVISADVARGQTNWMVFYTLVGLRDLLIARQATSEAVLHVYGGDYGLPWGRGEVPKAERISHMVTEIGRDGSGGRIHHYVGPLLTTGGRKLSKSKGHGGLPEEVDFDQLMGLLGSGREVVEVG